MLNKAFFSYKRLGDTLINSYINKLLKNNFTHFITIPNKKLCDSLNIKYQLVPINEIPYLINLRNSYSNPYKLYSNTIDFMQITKSIFEKYQLYFPKKKIREKYLFKNVEYIQFKKTQNIYLSYLNGLNKNLNELNLNFIKNSSKNISIFPKTSDTKKDINQDFLMTFLSDNKLNNFDYNVYIFEDPLKNGYNKLNITYLKSFDDTINKILDSRIVISADTLYSHLATFLGIPTICLFNHDNFYYSPLYSFINSTNLNIKKDNQTLTIKKLFNILIKIL